MLIGEQDAIRLVVEAGKKYGFGNMIHRLQVAWVLELKESGCPTWHSAALGALLPREEAQRYAEHDGNDDRPLIKWMREYTGQSAATELPLSGEKCEECGEPADYARQYGCPQGRDDCPNEGAPSEIEIWQDGEEP